MYKIRSVDVKYHNPNLIVGKTLSNIHYYYNENMKKLNKEFLHVNIVKYGKVLLDHFVSFSSMITPLLLAF